MTDRKDRRPARHPADSERKAHRDSFLETVESLIVAFILAFVFRAYVVEAFVIPTGSMAPRLNGKHIECTCANCGYPYRVGIGKSGLGAVAWECPLCGHTRVTQREAGGFVGDRILVLKYYYDFFPPERWDVIVFKFPGDTTENYIKRLVGLPGETVEVRDGDVYINSAIARKPDRAQSALWMPVGDTDYWDWKNGPHWQPESGGDRSWQHGRMPVTFRPDGDQMSYLVYHHFGPGGQEVPIRDFYAYDDPLVGEGRGDNRQIVTDIRLVADLEVTGAPGEGTVELVLGACGDTFRFILPVEGSGQTARILHNDEVIAKGDTAPLPVGRKVAIEVANVDQKLVFKVDGRRVICQPGSDGFDEFGDVVYDVPAGARQRWLASHKAEDAAAVKIGIAGTEATLHRLRVGRDIHYTKIPPPTRSPGFGIEGLPYELHDDEFFVLGDNSPQSQDSRWWEDSPVVPRRNLVGKAFFVYWPAAGRRYGVPIPVAPDIRGFRFIR